MTQDLKKKLKSRWRTFTASEQRIAGYLVQNLSGLPFETAAVILTVALVVAVMLTLRRRPGTKHQDPARQVAVRREDRVRLVKVQAEPRQEGNP